MIHFFFLTLHQTRTCIQKEDKAEAKGLIKLSFYVLPKVYANNWASSFDPTFFVNEVKS